MKRTLRIVLLLASVAALPVMARAAGWILCDPQVPMGQSFACDTCFLFMTIQLIIRWVMGLAFTAAVGIVVYNGVMLYFSEGNPGKVSQCWTNIRNVAIGLALMILAWTIVNTIVAVFANPSSPLQSWFEIKCVNMEMPVGPEACSHPTGSCLINSTLCEVDSCGVSNVWLCSEEHGGFIKTIANCPNGCSPGPDSETCAP